MFNGVMPIRLRCGSAAMKTTRLKLEASLYVPGARFGTRVLSWVKVVEPLLLWLHYCHVLQLYLNTRHFPRTVQGGK